MDGSNSSARHATLYKECGMSATFTPKPFILINNTGTARFS
jgi:hypothetical protein